MEATLDVFAKKMGDVLEKDNEFLLEMQASQHKHEMSMMTFLGQMIKEGHHGQSHPTAHHYIPTPPISPSPHPHFPQPFFRPMSPYPQPYLQSPPNAHQWSPQGGSQMAQPSFLRDLEDPFYPPPFPPPQGQSQQSSKE